MKSLLVFFIIFGFVLTTQAQSCLPDSTYKDSLAGVYPRPVSPSYPNAGIKKKACINKPYEFVFTVVIPDSILVPPLTSPAPLDKVEIAPSGAISNLPEGISYACNPPNCVYLKNTIGCLRLFGTPTSNNNPGDYKPIIKLTVTAFGGFIRQNIDYPGPAFPGEYILTLESETDCTASSENSRQVSAHWYPNPASSFVTCDQENIEDLHIFNAVGQLVFKARKHQGKLLTPYGTGMYFIQWKSNGIRYRQKIRII